MNRSGHHFGRLRVDIDRHTELQLFAQWDPDKLSLGDAFDERFGEDIGEKSIPVGELRVDGHIDVGERSRCLHAKSLPIAG